LPTGLRGSRLIVTVVRMAADVDPFTPAQGAWHRVSPRMATARRVVLGIVMSFPVSVTSVAVGLASGPVRTLVTVVLVGFLLLAAWLFWLIGRQVAAYGFAESEEDLLVTSGVMFKRLVIVPYGRMQLVDVVAGPIDRLFGITTVQLHTAAATTDASIPGLLPRDAAAVRDRLASLGEKRSAGL
jgi:uncharacterized protein